MQIPRDNIDLDEYVVEDEWNDYISNWCVTKIKLIPKIILRSRIKSAKKNDILNLSGQINLILDSILN